MPLELATWIAGVGCSATIPLELAVGLHRFLELRAARASFRYALWAVEWRHIRIPFSGRPDAPVVADPSNTSCPLADTPTSPGTCAQAVLDDINATDLGSLGKVSHRNHQRGRKHVLAVVLAVSGLPTEERVWPYVFFLSLVFWCLVNNGETKSPA